VTATTKNQISGYTYDAAGNMTTNPGVGTYTYDAENRMTATAGVTYTYDGDGKRVKKSSGKLYWYGMGSDALLETDAAGGAPMEFIFFGGKRIARRDSGGAVSYFFADHLGTSRVVTNATGTPPFEESDYYPFGGERVVTDTLPDQNYKFTGKERDAESNLDFFIARHYASNLGRFLQPDEFTGGPVDAFSSTDPLPPGPLPYADIRDPQSLNKYAYTYNNPLRHTDPDGHGPCPPCVEPEIVVRMTVYVYNSAGPAAASFGTSLLLKVGSVGLYFLSFGADPIGPSGSEEKKLVQEAQQQQQQEQQQQEGQTDQEPEPDAGGASVRKGGKGADTRRTTTEKHADLEGAQDQRESIDHTQQKFRKTGQGEKLKSTKKSEQDEKTRLNRIKSAEDLAKEKP
jgi:RHS repeat-associated protein